MTNAAIKNYHTDTLNDANFRNPPDSYIKATSGAYTPEKNRVLMLRKIATNRFFAPIKIYIPTYVKRVIEDRIIEDEISETLIELDSLLAKILVARQAQKLETPFKANNPDEVRAFLRRHPELIKHLNYFSEAIPKNLLNSTTIEYYKDIEEDWEKLFILIKTGIKDFDQLGRLEKELYGTLIETLELAIQDKIVLAVS